MDIKIVTKGLKKTADFLLSKGVKLADENIDTDVIGPIQLIVGADYYGRFLHKVTKKFGVQVLTSSGGKVIMGSLPFSNSIDPNSNLVEPVFVTPMQTLVARIGAEVVPFQIGEILGENTEPVHKLWDLDTIGINSNEPPPEDRITHKHYLETVKYENGQYWVSLPWKLNVPDLPTNYKLAKGQLCTLLSRVSKNENHLQLYDDIIKEQLKNGFIEKVPGVVDHKVGHYLPHHSVCKDFITTPIRVVFNCSAKADKESPSLNDCLYTGPNLSEKLGDVLLKFRVNKYAYVADISKAFLRVGLNEPDRDFTRFLWPEDPFDPDSSLVTYRFKSVLFGSCSSPFLLCSTLQYHFDRSESPEIGQAFYMDNLQGTVNTEQEAIDIYKFANKECQKANMPLQSWNTNSNKLRNMISQDYPNYEIPNRQTILGLEWDIMTDRLGIKNFLFPDVVLTK